MARKIKIKAGIEMFATHKEPVNKLPPASTVSPVNLPGKETNEISRETESTVGFSSGLNELFTERPVVSQGRRACGKEGEKRGRGGGVLYRRKLSRIPRSSDQVRAFLFR